MSVMTISPPPTFSSIPSASAVSTATSTYIARVSVTSSALALVAAPAGIGGGGGQTSLGTGEVVGISIGIIFVVIIVAIGVVFFYRRWKNKDMIQKRKMLMYSLSRARDISPSAALGRGRKLFSSTKTTSSTATTPSTVFTDFNRQLEIPNLIIEPSSLGTITSAWTPSRRSDKLMQTPEKETFSAVNPMNHLSA